MISFRKKSPEILSASRIASYELSPRLQSHASAIFCVSRVSSMLSLFIVNFCNSDKFYKRLYRCQAVEGSVLLHGAAYLYG